MTVMSMQRRLEEFTCKHLSRVVPEDVEVVYDVATIVLSNVCEEGHVHPETKVRVHLYAEFPRPTTQKICVSASMAMPFEFVSDGDTAPMAGVLDGLWEQLRFLNISADVAPDLIRVMEEHGEN